MEKLEYKGDVHAYQISAVACVQELQDAKCTIMDYVLMKIMHSFDGKSFISPMSFAKARKAPHYQPH